MPEFDVNVAVELFVDADDDDDEDEYEMRAFAVAFDLDETCYLTTCVRWPYHYYYSSIADLLDHFDSTVVRIVH